MRRLDKDINKETLGVASIPPRRWDILDKLKLESLGIKIDTLTEEQKKYLSSWNEGT